MKALFSKPCAILIFLLAWSLVTLLLDFIIVLDVHTLPEKTVAIQEEDKFDSISNQIKTDQNILKECEVRNALFRTKTGKVQMKIGADLDMELFRMLIDSPSINHQNAECMEALGNVSIIHESICRHRFLWLSGLHFSGTSLTNYILQTIDGISGHVETGVPMDEGQHLQHEFPRDFEMGDPCSEPSFHPGYNMDENHELATDKSRACIYAEWAKYWNLNQPILLEKSPLSLQHLKYRQWLYPGVSANIVVVRHPLYGCVIHPNKRRPQNFFKKEKIESALYHWLESHKYLSSIITDLDKYAILMYENFYAQDDPVAELASIVSTFFPDVIPIEDKNTSVPEFRRRRLPFRGGSDMSPKINKSLLLEWGKRWNNLASDNATKEGYDQILPILNKYEREVNEYGYSLLNVLEINITAFKEKFDQKYEP